MKVSLDRSHFHEGASYGPGEVEVPDELAKSLAERGLIPAIEVPEQPQSTEAKTRKLKDVQQPE